MSEPVVKPAAEPAAEPGDRGPRPGRPPGGLRAVVPGAPLRAKLLRYAGGSVVATVCSEVALVVAYGVLHVSPTWSALIGWLAGALPNYWLNRAWTWRRTGRPSLRGEVLPYVVVIGITLLIATVVTRGLDAWLHHLDVAAGLRVALVAVAFLGVYVVMFVLRFFLLDRLFERLSSAETETTDPTGTDPTETVPPLPQESR